jgi:hypothetical protein
MIDLSAVPASIEMSPLLLEELRNIAARDGFDIDGWRFLIEGSGYVSRDLAVLLLERPETFRQVVTRALTIHSIPTRRLKSLERAVNEEAERLNSQGSPQWQRRNETVRNIHEEMARRGLGPAYRPVPRFARQVRELLDHVEEVRVSAEFPEPPDDELPAECSI